MGSRQIVQVRTEAVGVSESVYHFLAVSLGAIAGTATIAGHAHRHLPQAHRRTGVQRHHVDGCSVDTTMGFTPLEGLVMATRSGTVDPGIVLWLQEHEHLTAREVATALEHRSGLVALAGTPDMREIEVRARDGHQDAALALDVYLHRLTGGIAAAMAAAAGGLDVLVFTGGVGEGSSRLRQRAAERLGWLGVTVDSHRNHPAHGDTDITGATATVQTWVVMAREDLQIARESRRVLGRR